MRAQLQISLVFALLALLTTAMLSAQVRNSGSISSFFWLEGIWRSETQPRIFEEWHINPNGSLSGKLTERRIDKTGAPGQVVRIIETRVIVQVDQQIFLAVNFPGTTLSEHRYTWRIGSSPHLFTNKNLPFPQIIVYQRLRGNRKMKIIHSDYRQEDSNEQVTIFEKISGRRWRFN